MTHLLSDFTSNLDSSHLVLFPTHPVDFLASPCISVNTVVTSLKTAPYSPTDNGLLIGDPNWRCHQRRRHPTHKLCLNRMWLDFAHICKYIIQFHMYHKMLYNELHENLKKNNPLTNIFKSATEVTSDFNGPRSGLVSVCGVGVVMKRNAWRSSYQPVNP